MHIEAFSEGRYPARPELNEDALVIVPGRAYAVIDGATDTSGRRYEGDRTSGRVAASLVAGALNIAFGGAQTAAFDAAAVVGAATATIALEYRRLGVAAADTADRNGRFNATLALAVTDVSLVHLLLVGDSGIRVNGTMLYQDTKLLDEVTASLRANSYHRLAERGVDEPERDALAAKVTFRGTRNCAAEVTPFLSAGDLAAIEAEIVEHYQTHHPEVPLADIQALVHGGVVFGQPLYQNNPSSVLGYAGLDGFPVPMQLTRHVVLPAREVRSIELFSDGYFAPGDAVGLASWEAMFARVERDDAAKVGHYRSVKGSGGDGRRSDDRSYLCVRPYGG